MNHAPVSRTSRLPSASSMTSVGWKSGSRDVRKSESSVRNVAPSRCRTCRCTRCGLNCALKRFPWYSAPNAAPRYRARPGGRDAREFRHHRHQVAGLLELAHHRIPLRVDAAFDEVQQRVALAVRRILEIRHGADRLAGRREDQFHGIVESAAREPLQARAVRPHAPDAGSQAFVRAAVLGLEYRNRGVHR